MFKSKTLKQWMHVTYIMEPNKILLPFQISFEVKEFFLVQLLRDGFLSETKYELQELQRVVSEVRAYFQFCLEESTYTNIDICQILNYFWIVFILHYRYLQ